MDTTARLPLARMAPFILLLAAACGSDEPTLPPLEQPVHPCTETVLFPDFVSGQPAAGPVVQWRIEYVFDAQDRVIGSRRTNAGGAVTSEYTASYDADGFLVLETERDPGGSDEKRTHYAYDHGRRSYVATTVVGEVEVASRQVWLNERGDAVEIRESSGETIRFSYDGTGRLTETVRTDASGEIGEGIRFFFDRDGRITREERLNREQLAGTYVYAYGAGLLVRKDYVDAVTGDTGGFFVAYEYDAAGRASSETQMFEDGQIDLRTEWTYECWAP